MKIFFNKLFKTIVQGMVKYDRVKYEKLELPGKPYPEAPDKCSCCSKKAKYWKMSFIGQIAFGLCEDHKECEPYIKFNSKTGIFSSKTTMGIECIEKGEKNESYSRRNI